MICSLIIDRSYALIKIEDRRDGRARSSKLKGDTQRIGQPTGIAGAVDTIDRHVTGLALLIDAEDRLAFRVNGKFSHEGINLIGRHLSSSGMIVLNINRPTMTEF